jgi:threonine dehydratase
MLQANDTKFEGNSIYQNPFYGSKLDKYEGDGTEPDYLQLILTAKVYDVAIETPLTRAINLSNRLQNNILLKREDLQPVFSFKLRGAYNKMAHMTEAELSQGVLACSAGNHAQGVALAASKMGIPATIIMPACAPKLKCKSVERLGAKVVLFGEDFQEAKYECDRLHEVQQVNVRKTKFPSFRHTMILWL